MCGPGSSRTVQSTSRPSTTNFSSLPFKSGAATGILRYIDQFPNQIATETIHATASGSNLTLGTLAFLLNQGFAAFPKGLFCQILSTRSRRQSIPNTISNPAIKLLRLSRNFGKELALTAGLDHAGGAAVVVIDADQQDSPELIPDLLDKWCEGSDVVRAPTTFGPSARPSGSGAGPRSGSPLPPVSHSLPTGARAFGPLPNCSRSVAG